MEYKMRVGVDDVINGSGRFGQMDAVCREPFAACFVVRWRLLARVIWMFGARQCYSSRKVSALRVYHLVDHTGLGLGKWWRLMDRILGILMDRVVVILDKV
jgi:hypothetical protein